MSTRQTVLFSLGMLLLVALGAWWYFGFSLDFMRFFAAEPGVTDTTNLILGATPSGSQSGCVQRPACLDATPRCMIVQPAEGWCPPSGARVSCTPASSTVTVGAIVNITATGGTGGYVFTAPGGTLSMQQNSLAIDTTGVQYATPGVKQVLVTAKRASDPTQTDVATCRVTVIPAAVTN